MNITGKLLCIYHSSLRILIRKRATHRLKTRAKGKTKVRNISLRGLHKLQAGLGCKKRIKNFHIWL